MSCRGVFEHADTGAAPGTGYDPLLKRGKRHETGGIVWKLPNGGGFQSVEYEDANATQCNYHYPANPTPPVSGATTYARYHTHSTSPGEDYYGCSDSIQVAGRHIPAPQYAGDPCCTTVPTVGPDIGGGSEADWERIFVRDSTPDYVMHKEGHAAKLVKWTIPQQNDKTWPYSVEAQENARG